MASLGIVGDLMLDVVACVPDDVERAAQAKHVYAPIETLTGGTALIAARAAAAAGFDPIILLGAVGADANGTPDPAALRIGEDLGAIKVLSRLKFVRGSPTGVVTITTFNNDQRLLIANPGANLQLTSALLNAEDIVALSRCHLTLFSGYFLLQEDRAQMVISLMRECKATGTLVALDLVPHRLETRTLALERCLGMVDAVISEVGTARRIWGADLEVHTRSEVEALACEMAHRHRFVLLRSSNECELLIADGAVSWLHTRYDHVTHAAQRGYLDQLAIRHLYAWLTHP